MDTARLGPLTNYYNAVSYGSGFGPGDECRAARDRVPTAELTDEQLAALTEIDTQLIDWVVGEDDDAVWWELVEDDASQSIDRWWWHLGALRNGTYPIDRLPVHLRTVYAEARAAA